MSTNIPSTTQSSAPSADTQAPPHKPETQLDKAQQEGGYIDGVWHVPRKFVMSGWTTLEESGYEDDSDSRRRHFDPKGRTSTPEFMKREKSPSR